MDKWSADAIPRVLGITGPIGCGKTTVGDILLRLGARERIDADRVVHDRMLPASPIAAEIAAAFGNGVLRSDGSVDRSHVAQIVFHDEDELRKLERIVHPAVRTAIRTTLSGLAGQGGIVVIEAIKLLQSELIELVEVVWVIHCTREEQLRRLVTIRGMTPDEAAARQRAQPSFDHPRVARVIQNSGTEQELEERVRRTWDQFTAGPH